MRCPIRTGATCTSTPASAAAIWSASWPRGAHPLSNATTGADVTARTRAAVSAAASTSSTDGRQGSSTRSASLAAACAALSLPARGGVSMIARSVPASAQRCSSAASRDGGTVSTTGKAAARRSPHLAADCWGSVSSTATLRPCCAAATAIWTAAVVLPLPPFMLTSATVAASRRRLRRVGLSHRTRHRPVTHRTQRSGGPRARQKTKLSGRWIGADGAFAVLAGLDNHDGAADVDLEDYH